MTIHLHPTAPLAERVLLPGDPGRALHLAQALLERPAMFNHNRGLWGYTGAASDGHLLTVQSTGMGGPSAAIVVAELAELGARRLLRVGTCGALDPGLGLGELLIVTGVLPGDGASRALGAGEHVAPDPELLGALREAAGDRAREGTVASIDLFYEEDEAGDQAWIEAGARALDMETATLFALAGRRGLQAASLLAVSDLLLPTRKRITPDELREAELRLGRAGLGALSALSRSATA